MKNTSIRMEIEEQTLEDGRVQVHAHVEQDRSGQTWTSNLYGHGASRADAVADLVSNKMRASLRAGIIAELNARVAGEPVGKESRGATAGSGAPNPEKAGEDSTPSLPVPPDPTDTTRQPSSPEELKMSISSKTDDPSSEAKSSEPISSEEDKSQATPDGMPQSTKSFLKAEDETSAPNGGGAAAGF